MTNSSTSPPQRSAAGVSLRKTNKPLMEKRRRARINDSLSQLKSLVIQSTKKDSSQFNKLEKADILELTVKHLRNLQNREQQQHLAQAVTTDSAGKYCAGFIECANEVIRFLKQSQGFSDDVKARVVGHLAGCLQFTTNQSIAKTSPPQLSTPSAATTTTVLTTGPGPVVGPVQPTSAQLSNGQIIHIVNTQQAFNAAKPCLPPSSSAPTSGQMLPAPPSSPSSIPKTSICSAEPPKVVLSQQQQQQYQTQQQLQEQSMQMPILPLTCSVPTTLASSPNMSDLKQDKSFTPFSQPLHIQIPATVSPFVIKADPHNLQPVKRLEESNSIPGVNHHRLQSSKLPHQTTSISSVETVGCNTAFSSTPSPQHDEIAIHTQIKHVHFNSSDPHVSNDYLPHHRIRTYSSSSESEMSPLNLSQSPVSTTSSSCSYETIKEYVACPTQSQTRGTYVPVNYKLEKISPPSGYSPYGHQQLREFPENMDLAQANFTSVIVNARRSLDMTHSKFGPVEVEDDRLCPRQHSTPSPASSMGEERLWRPW